MANSLKQIMFVEREVEAVKIELALRPDFNLVDAFRIFDIKIMGACSLQDLIDGLRRNLEISDLDIEAVQMFFHRFDKSLGHISFNQFANAVLPFTHDYAKMVTERPDFYIRQGSDCREYFTRETRCELQRLMKCIFAGERQTALINQALARRQNYDAHAIFSLIDSDGDDYIRSGELRDFFAQSGFYASDRELQGLLNRFDVDKTHKVSFDQFRKGLQV